MAASLLDSIASTGAPALTPGMVRAQIRAQQIQDAKRQLAQLQANVGRAAATQPGTFTGPLTMAQAALPSTGVAPPPRVAAPTVVGDHAAPTPFLPRTPGEPGGGAAAAAAAGQDPNAQFLDLVGVGKNLYDRMNAPTALGPGDTIGDYSIGGGAFLPPSGAAGAFGDEGFSSGGGIANLLSGLLSGGGEPAGMDQGFSAGGGVDLGGLMNIFGGGGEDSKAGGALRGAASGASTGAMVGGPYGAAAGGLIGALLSLLGGR